jgi:acyl-CoA synthetase (AMP-forming)/AMP-acid ligase II
MSSPDSNSTLMTCLATADGTALVDPDGGWALSFPDLRAEVESLAAQLAGAGVAPGDVVSLVLDHGPEAVLGFLAIVRLGAIALPLNRQLHPHEMTAAFEDRAPSLVIVGEDGHPAAQDAAATAGVPVERLTTGPDARLDGVSPTAEPIPDPDPAAVALLLHTSGTTSKPKAVPLRQRNLAASAQGISKGYGLGPDDVSLCLMPLFHIHGLVASTLSALTAGGAVVVPRRVRPGALWEHGAAHGVSWFSAVPTILAKLPARPDDDGDVRLRFARSCSSALDPTLWSQLEERLGVPLVEAYGMTEASHQMTSNPLPPGERRSGTVGLPAGADVAILNDDWEPLAPGEEGEVSVKGPGVVDGYLENEEANAASFRDGWFRTGDLGRLSDDGYLTLVGRIKELINRGGEKIAPREIDEALLTHPAVSEAVAFGRADPKWGEVVEAVVVVEGAIDPKELRAHCDERLAPFKVPKTVHVVEEIPKGPTGKVQRRLLADAIGG